MEDLSDVDFSSDSNSEPGEEDGGGSSGYPCVSSRPTSDTGPHSDSGMGSTSAQASGTDDRASTTDTEKERQHEQPTVDKGQTSQEGTTTGADSKAGDQTPVPAMTDAKLTDQGTSSITLGSPPKSDSHTNSSDQISSETTKVWTDIV